MKTFVILTVLFSYLINSSSSQLLGEQQMSSAHYLCALSSDAAVLNEITKALEGKPIESTNFRQYLTCFFQKMNFSDINNQLKMDQMKRFVPEDHEKKITIDRIINHCDYITSSGFNSTAANFFKCFRANSDSVINWYEFLNKVKNHLNLN
nr:uncharacterized protein LOC111416600 [Onthophagus taurus]XP_022910931.1 uncharacterized protein LOC111421973 [Onthophagus taurus]